MSAKSRGLTVGACRWVLAAVALLISTATWAQLAAATPFAAPEHEAAPSSAGGLLRVTVALILVLAAVLAAAWLTRRVRRFGGGGAENLQVLAQLPLGARERAVLIRVGDCQLLLGVAPGCVRTLHVLQTDALTAQPTSDAGESARAAAQRPTFKALLLKSLGK